MPDDTKDSNNVDRRGFLKLTTSLVAAGSAQRAAAQETGWVTADDFDRPDSLYHGDGWETINPGYWKIESTALRRKPRNLGDRNPTHHFPFHWESNHQKPIPVDVDPSLPLGMIWRRDWKMTGNYSVRAEMTVRALAPRPDDPKHAHHKSGYALMGVCFGGRTLYESRERQTEEGNGAWMALWDDRGQFGLYDHARPGPGTVLSTETQPAPALQVGDKVVIEVEVGGDEAGVATVTVLLHHDGAVAEVTADSVDRQRFAEGFFGQCGDDLPYRRFF